MSVLRMSIGRSFQMSMRREAGGLRTDGVVHCSCVIISTVLTVQVLVSDHGRVGLGWPAASEPVQY